MTLIILGLILFMAGHLFKRAMPDKRAALGDKGKAIAGPIILLGVVLMVIGYRGSDFVAVYFPPPWTVHLTNLLMVFSVILFGLGSSKSPLRSKMRHPMLTGTLIWAVAHLLVNGDLHSIVLFGGIGAWAVAEMLIINAKEPVYHRFEGGSMGGTIRLLVISAVVFAVITAIHAWLGVWPFPS